MTATQESMCIEINWTISQNCIEQGKPNEMSSCKIGAATVGCNGDLEKGSLSNFFIAGLGIV